MRAWCAVRRNRAREIAPGVVLSVLITNATQNLRVRGDNVKGLHEGFLQKLPIARHDLAHMRFNVSLFGAPHFKVLKQITVKVFEGFCIHVHVNEHPATPLAYLYRREIKIVFVDVGEVPLRSNI